MKTDLETLKQRLGELTDPTCCSKLSDKNAITHVGIDEEKGTAVIALDIEPCSEQVLRDFRLQVTKLVKLDLGFPGMKLDINKKDFNVGGAKKPRIIGIASGKGGVGKSTVAANVALNLARIGKKVGIIDADIYGYSIPHIFDIGKIQLRTDANEKIIPVESNGIEIVSTQFFMPEIEKPLLWRGPMLGKILGHFFNDVVWREDIEYIIVDLPPGTGDVHIDLKQYIPSCEMIVVTTPHPTASFVAIKAGHGAKELGHPVLGVIENMSYYTIPKTKEKVAIFGEGGGEGVASKLDVPLLAKLPIAQPDDHHTLHKLGTEIGLSYLSLVKNIVNLES